MTKNELSKYLSYDESTGEFTWLKPISKRTQVGDVAGSDSNGSILIVINKKIHGTSLSMAIHDG